MKVEYKEKHEQKFDYFHGIISALNWFVYTTKTTWNRQGNIIFVQPKWGLGISWQNKQGGRRHRREEFLQVGVHALNMGNGRRGRQLQGFAELTCDAIASPPGAPLLVVQFVRLKKKGCRLRIQKLPHWQRACHGANYIRMKLGDGDNDTAVQMIYQFITKLRIT